MPIPNSIAARADDLAEWRRDFHRHPELGYSEHRTAAEVARRLAEFGFDAVETGVGQTGVVGVLHGRGGPGGPAIMLRADMDALPITEATGRPYASVNKGVMHACGHDGHTTMLLGAAEHLAQTRAFEGTVIFCFQPAEENGAGAKAMIDDGLLSRHRPRAAYGMHNWPGLPVGRMAVTEGPVLAAAETFRILLTGRGGHAAEPHLSNDTLVAGAHLVTALQSIVSRRVDPRQPAVLSITRFAGGETTNVLPETAELLGTVRSFDPATQALVMENLRRMVTRTAESFAIAAEITELKNGYPATINDAEEARFAHGVMTEVLGAEAVQFGHPPTMASEDFAFVANEVPSAFVMIGNGDSAMLHHPAYDFDDRALPLGVAFWSRLVERALPGG